MRTLPRRALGAAFAAFVAVQLAHSLFDANRWPFCSYNMFAFVPPRRTGLLEAVLYHDDGSTQVVPPGRLIPVEFFRANGIAARVFGAAGDDARKDRLARLLLARLNRAPWSPFDERYAPAVPPSGSSFIGFDITWRSVEYAPSEERRIVRQRRVLYSYLEERRR